MFFRVDVSPPRVPTHRSPLSQTIYGRAMQYSGVARVSGHVAGQGRSDMRCGHVSGGRLLSRFSRDCILFLNAIAFFRSDSREFDRRYNLGVAGVSLTDARIFADLTAVSTWWRHIHTEKHIFRQ